MIEATMKPRPRDRAASAFKRWLFAACIGLGALVMCPSAAFAQDEDIKQDARLEGYTGNVSVPNQSTALMWLLFVFLGVVALAALFKDAKRTHLD
jgi:hypothetical protein